MKPSERLGDEAEKIFGKGGRQNYDLGLVVQILDEQAEEIAHLKERLGKVEGREGTELPTEIEPHAFTNCKGKTIWKNGDKDEPYEHQDRDFSKLCGFVYCRCRQ